MTMKLPQKAGFVPTVQEWDQLVRIAENLAAQLVHRDAESLKAAFDAHEKINQLSGDLYGAQMALAQAQAQRDAARAEVARLTAALAALIEQADVAWATLDHTENERLVSRLGCAVDDARAALRGQPAPAPAKGQE